MYKLNYSQAQVLQLSNDAFFYLKEEEEPLDEENLEEAQEVLQMFPAGFIIEDDWKPVDGTDMIEAKFVPYTEDNDDYDLCQELAKGTQLQLKWLNQEKTQARVWRSSDYKGTRELYGDFEVKQNNRGLWYFEKGVPRSGKWSMFFLKHFKTR